MRWIIRLDRKGYTLGETCDFAACKMFQLRNEMSIEKREQTERARSENSNMMR
jgi:hypothetical protein